MVCEIVDLPLDLSAEPGISGAKVDFVDHILQSMLP
jgi:hypothetical protein